MTRLNANAPARLPWVLWGLGLVLVLTGVLLLGIADQGWAVVILVGFVAVELGASTAGAVIASRLPRNAVGWIFLTLGVGIGLVTCCWAWSGLGLDTSHGPLPGDEFAAWLGHWGLVPVFFGLPLFLLQLFPNGRFLSPRWRRVGIGIAAVVTVGTLSTAFLPGRIDPGIENPYAPSGAVGDVIEVVDTITLALAVPGFTLSVAALVVRLRRSRGVERQQLKWFTYSSAIAVVALGSVLMSGDGESLWILFTISLIALAGMPVAAGMAMLRYRLYDIDVVINRTLVYAGLTAILAATYAALVLLLQLLLSPGSDLAIAASTLAVAALFRPARAQIQAAVDRRFYRRKYDASRTIASFSARLRDEIELDSLSSELRSVVAETMQPTQVSLWLRGSP